MIIVSPLILQHAFAGVGSSTVGELALKCPAQGEPVLPDEFGGGARQHRVSLTVSQVGHDTGVSIFASSMDIAAAVSQGRRRSCVGWL